MAIAAQETYYPKIVRVVSPDKPKIVRLLVPGPPGPSNHGDAVVSDYVRTGDGDDTFSFLRAIQTGKSVFVPKRSTPYLLDPTSNLLGLNLRNLQQPLVEITGEGPGRSVLKWKGPTGLGDNDPLFWFKDAPMRLVFRSLTWDGNKDAFTGADDGGYTQNFVRFEVPSPSRQSEIIIEDVEMINQRRVGLWIDEPPEGDVIRAYLHGLADREGLLAASITDACQAVHVSGKGVDLTVRDFTCTLSRDVTSLDPVTPADYGRAGLVVQIEDTPADPTENTYRSRVSVIGAYGRNVGHGMGNTLGLVDVYSGGDTVEVSNVRGDGVYGRLVCVKADAAQTIITDVIGRKIRGDNATGIAVFRSPTKGGNAQRNMHIQTVQIDDVAGTGSYGVLVDGASENDVAPFFESAELLDLVLSNIPGNSAILVRNCKTAKIRAEITGASAGVSFSGMQEVLDISNCKFSQIANTGVSGFTFVRDNANLQLIANGNKFFGITQRCYDLPPIKSFAIDGDTVDSAAIYLRWQGTTLLSSVKGVVGHSVTTPYFRASGVDAGGFFWAQTNRFDNASTFALLNLTISGGKIDPVTAFHYLSAEGGVDDDLDWIKLGFDGQLLFLQQASNTYKIRVRAAIASPPAGYGPIHAPNNRQLSNTRDIIQLVCSTALQAWLAFPVGRNSVALNGSTAQRPALLTATDVGYMFFDSTLGLPIFWNGAGWRKADGTVA